MLAYADFSLPFILEVDASHGGLGAVLSQEQQGKVRPIAYGSCSLRPTERNTSNYSSMKLEFLALKWAMTEKFMEYLLGHKGWSIHPSWYGSDAIGLGCLPTLLSGVRSVRGVSVPRVPTLPLLVLWDT